MSVTQLVSDTVLKIREEATGDWGVVYIGYSATPFSDLLEQLLLNEKRLKRYTESTLMEAIFKLIDWSVLKYDELSRVVQHRDAVQYSAPTARRGKMKGKRRRQNTTRKARLKVATSR